MQKRSITPLLNQCCNSSLQHHEVLNRDVRILVLRANCSVHMLGGETAMWGEGINKDNFDAFVWREAAAAAERLWTTEMVLGCPEQICTGINAAATAAGVKLPPVSRWLTSGDNPNRLDDQLCRMSRMGVRTGPIAPGFCPSDKDQSVQAATNFELEQRHRLEAQLGELRVQLAAALLSGSMAE